MKVEVKSLAAFLFFNLMEILNRNNKKEEIVSLVKSGLSNKVTEIFDDITTGINKDKSTANQPKDLYALSDKCDNIKQSPDYFELIDRLSALNMYLANLGYYISDADKNILTDLRRAVDGNQDIRGASRSQVVQRYKHFKKYKRLFMKKRVEILVKCVIVPIMIKEKMYEEVIEFLFNTDNYFHGQNKRTEFFYPDYASISISIEKLTMLYKKTIPSEGTFDKESFEEYLIAVFLQLEDSSYVRFKETTYKDKSTAPSVGNDVVSDIDEFIAECLGRVLDEETSGIVSEEKNSIYMRITTLIHEDYLFYNKKFNLSWEECDKHNGFMALKYYRMYKILYDYEDNDCLNELGQALVKECWKKTLIYISPDANIVAPVYIGNNCLITSSCWIERNVIIGHGTKILSSRIKAEQDMKKANKEIFSLIKIYADTIIMPNCLIYDAANIKKDCIISSLSVVMEDIEKAHIFINGIPQPIDLEDTPNIYENFIKQLREDELICVRI